MPGHKPSNSRRQRAEVASAKMVASWSWRHAVPSLAYRYTPECMHSPMVQFLDPLACGNYRMVSLHQRGMRRIRRTPSRMRQSKASPRLQALCEGSDANGGTAFGFQKMSRRKKSLCAQEVKSALLESCMDFHRQTHGERAFAWRPDAACMQRDGAAPRLRASSSRSPSP